MRWGLMAVARKQRRNDPARQRRIAEAALPPPSYVFRVAKAVHITFDPR